MNFNQIDEYFDKVLSKYKEDTERRDYIKMEEKDPTFKGYGNRCGLMYLVDVGIDHYIDINILSDKVKMVFRKDDDDLISLSISHSDNIEDYYNSFDILIDEYFTFLERSLSLSQRNIPMDIKRNITINKVYK